MFCILDKTCSENFHIGDKIFGKTFAVKHFVETCDETFMLKTRLSVNHVVLERRFSGFTFKTRFLGKHFIFAMNWDKTIDLYSRKNFEFRIFYLRQDVLGKKIVFQTSFSVKHFGSFCSQTFCIRDYTSSKTCCFQKKT